MQQPLAQTPQRPHRRILRQRGDIASREPFGQFDEPLDLRGCERVFLRGEQAPELLLAHPGFREGDVLPADETAARGFVDGPGEVGRGEDEDARGVAVFVFAPRGGFLQVGPLDQELRFDAARDLVLAAAAAAAEQRVDSSTKMMLGARALARVKSARTSFSLSPRNLDVRLLAEMAK